MTKITREEAKKYFGNVYLKYSEEVEKFCKDNFEFYERHYHSSPIVVSHITLRNYIAFGLRCYNCSEWMFNRLGYKQISFSKFKKKVKRFLAKKEATVKKNLTNEKKEATCEFLSRIAIYPVGTRFLLNGKEHKIIKVLKEDEVYICEKYCKVFIIHIPFIVLHSAVCFEIISLGETKEPKYITTHEELLKLHGRKVTCKTYNFAVVSDKYLQKLQQENKELKEKLNNINELSEV